MRRIALLVVGLALLPDCGSKSTPDELSDPDRTGHDANPDGVPYPTANIGTHARSGDLPGNVIANLTFQGYPQSDASKGLQTVSMADYYDPTAKDRKVLYLSAAASWCVNCDEASDEAVAVASKYRAMGAVFVEVLVNGTTPEYGPSLGELDAWVGKHKTAPDITVLVDVRARRMAPLGVTNVPWSALVDTRTMEILHSTLGAPDDVGAYVQIGLDWVNSHPPSVEQ
jgi:hypothetical protein